MSEVFRLESASLFSKDGFKDGDIFQDWLDYHLRIGSRLTHQKLLKAAVQKFLIAKIRQCHRIKVDYRHGIINNRIIAYEFEGVAVQLGDGVPRLNPEYVEVSERQLVALFPNDLSEEVVERDL